MLALYLLITLAFAASSSSKCMFRISFNFILSLVSRTHRAAVGHMTELLRNNVFIQVDPMNQFLLRASGNVQECTCFHGPMHYTYCDLEADEMTFEHEKRVSYLLSFELKALHNPW